MKRSISTQVRDLRRQCVELRSRIAVLTCRCNRFLRQAPEPREEAGA